MRVSKIGDDYVLTLPEAIVEALDVADGDDLIVRIDGKQKPGSEPVKDRQWAIRQLKSVKYILPDGWKFDREEANSR